jgi:hypothetical protein
MKSMCCLCIQFTHENTPERTILHLVKKNNSGRGKPGLVACTAKKASYAPVYDHALIMIICTQFEFNLKFYAGNFPDDFTCTCCNYI